jgi:hypothetical protein
MKKSALLFSLVLIMLGNVYGQENQTWQTPMHEVKFIDNGTEEAIMKVDPALNYADLSHNERMYRLLFIYGPGKIKHARIIDQDSKLQVARGKGSYFWGNARFEFIGGDVFRVKLNRNRNGYEIIGPYGPLFIVENFGISPVKTLNEKDFLMQAFYVFDRIKTTQTPPTDVIIITSSINTIK